MVSNVDQSRGENVGTYICEKCFFVICPWIEIKFKKNISLISYVIECWFKIFIQNAFALDLIWNQMGSSAIWVKLQFLWHLHEFNCTSSKVSLFFGNFHSLVRYHVIFYRK